jgi:hypothetical protein
LATGAPKPTLIMGVATEVSASVEVVHATESPSSEITIEPSPQTEASPATGGSRQSKPSVESEVEETVYGQVVAAY